MVSQDSPPNPASSMVQQFFVSESFTSQNQFQNQNFNAYGSDWRGNNNSFHHNIQSFDGSSLIPQESEISHTRHLMDLLGAANANNHQAQSLSLSLGCHMLVPQVHYRQRSMNSDFFSSGNPGIEQVNDDESFSGNAFGLSRSSSTSYGTESFGLTVKNSRYLKPAQMLLEEIVSVGGKAVEMNNEKFMAKLFPGGRRGASGFSSELKAQLCSNNNNNLPPDKQHLQVKIAKLIALLEEIEGRYEKYCNQMEEAVSSFEEIAGFGAAKSYTALALQAMSRHFCNLRDAIVSQINATRRKFSQDLPKINTGLSRLSLFEGENSHTRSLQQLGMIQSQRQAWRPIRGLPENSVTILRSWLFEHFLHPYPNDSEKLMLASQTGLTKNQVSNWFINARVRLWKPMIEEMYKEEFAGDSSEDSNPLLGSSSKARGGGDPDHSED
ncbi:BEL1-like homeodomain protein 11 [Mercurialis annua]|uniref:BEL1-like homeodomain protein 11 n=1 Tax=Mercurialis annua TaxID=3986 RepID=UPI00215E6A91|nr:BEL1-like homeodomain protein 11 [Mercurialis annua]